MQEVAESEKNYNFLDLSCPTLWRILNNSVKNENGKPWNPSTKQKLL